MFEKAKVEVVLIETKDVVTTSCEPVDLGGDW